MLLIFPLLILWIRIEDSFFSANASAFQCLLKKSSLEVQLWYSGEMSLNLDQEIWPFPLICHFIKQGSIH